MLVLEDEIRIGKFLGERLQGKIEVGTDVGKKLNKSEYGNFLNTRSIMTDWTIDDAVHSRFV